MVFSPRICSVDQINGNTPRRFPRLGAVFLLCASFAANVLVPSVAQADDANAVLPALMKLCSENPSTWDSTKEVFSEEGFFTIEPTAGQAERLKHFVGSSVDIRAAVEMDTGKLNPFFSGSDSISPEEYAEYYQANYERDLRAALDLVDEQSSQDKAPSLHVFAKNDFVLFYDRALPSLTRCTAVFQDDLNAVDLLTDLHFEEPRAFSQNVIRIGKMQIGTKMRVDVVEIQNPEKFEERMLRRPNASFSATISVRH